MHPFSPHALAVLPLMSPFASWCWIPLKVKSWNVLFSTSKCGAVERIGFPASSTSPDANTPLSPPVNELWFTTTLAPSTVLEAPKTPVPAELPVMVKSELSTTT